VRVTLESADELLSVSIQLGGADNHGVGFDEAKRGESVIVALGNGDYVPRLPETLPDPEAVREPVCHCPLLQDHEHSG
jgi:hypothetical protein